MMIGNAILVISNEEPLLKFLKERLMAEAGFSLSFTHSSQSGIEALKSDVFDLVIAKYGMPDLETKRLIRELKNIDSDAIIILIGDDPNLELSEEVFAQGVYGFLTKPISLEKLFFLIKKGIELHALMLGHRKLLQGIQEQNLFLQKQNTLLAKRIEVSTQNLTRLYEDLRSTYMRTIKVLAQAIDARDHYTHSHSENVTRYAVAIAEEMGLSVKDIDMIRDACELHDLGKIGIEDSILSKPSGLTEEEWKQIKRHPQTGAQILEPLPFLNNVTELIRQHHEHYDGGGYPEGRKGEDILLGARIIHLADAYDSMVSARSYRKVPFTKEETIEEIKKKSGTQFDPKVVKAFLKVVDRL